MRQFLTLLLAAFSVSSNAQWELVTPIKSTSEYEDVVMVNDLVGYLVDRPSGTILATENGGAKWERRQHLLFNNQLAIHMWDEDRGISVGNSGSILRTTDGFRTATGASNPTYGTLNCVFFINDTLGWVGTQSGKIYRTTDAGVTWSLMQSGLTTSNYLTAIQFVDTQIGYASCYGGGYLLKSIDGGLTWQVSGPTELVLIRALYFYDALTGVAVGHAGHVIRTTDGGASWTFMPSNTTYNLVSLSVQGNNMVACGWWGRVVYSSNGGLTWTEQVFGPEHMSVAITPSGYGLMGSIGKIHRSTDFGASWALFQDGTSSGSINKISFANENMGVAANGTRTTDGGRSWVAAAGGGLGVHMSADGNGCRGGGSGSFGRTTDFFATGLPGVGPNVAIRCTWSFDAQTHIVAGGAVFGGIYRTTNGGVTWTHVLDVGNITISDLWFVNDQQGYAVGEYGDNYRTTDGGITWTPLPPTSGSHTVFFLDELHGWTASFRTVDGGDTWTYMGGTPQSTRSIFFTSADTGYAVSLTAQTVRSVDGGITWENILPEITNAAINDAAYVDGYIVIAGGLGDIYRAKVGCSSIADVPLVSLDGQTLCSSIVGDAQWYRNSELLEDETTTCITVEQGGLYHVIVTDAFGCTSAASATVQVLITGIDGASNDGLITIYPNPARSTVRMERNSDRPANIQFIDAQGRVVQELRVNGAHATLDVSSLRTGVYLLRVIDANGVSSLPMMKE